MTHFYWTTKRDTVDYLSLQKDQMTNHYAKAGSFTTKVSVQFFSNASIGSKNPRSISYTVSTPARKVRFRFSASGGLVHESEKPAVVRLDRPRHVLSTLLPAGSGGREASVRRSAPLFTRTRFIVRHCCRSLSSVSHPADDFRRTACTSLLRYVVERAGGRAEDGRGGGEIHHVLQPQGKTRANKTAHVNSVRVS